MPGHEATGPFAEAHGRRRPLQMVRGTGLPIVLYKSKSYGTAYCVVSNLGWRGFRVLVPRSALDWLDRTLQLPILLAGFSFGANVSWRAGCGDARVNGLVGLGMPLQAAGRQYRYDFISRCTQPKLLVTGAEDPFAPRELMTEVLQDAPPPLETHWVAGAEHFFMGVPGSPQPKLPEMQRIVRTWVQAHFVRS